MSQNSIALPNTGTLSGLSAVNDINGALDTLATSFSGPTAPATPLANQFWADTTAGVLRQRNSGNTAWLVRSSLSVDDNPLRYGVDSGAVNAVVISPQPAISAYAGGQMVLIKPGFTCTGAMTVNAGPGVVPLLNNQAGALQAGDVTASQLVVAVYDASHGAFLLINLVPSQALSQFAADARYAPLVSAVPTGSVLPFAGPTIPPGYLQIPTAPTNISRTTYAALFAAIGTTWGAGDGSTTFGLPYIGADGTLLQSNANLGTITSGQVKDHQHLVGGGSGGGGSGAISIGGTGVYSGSPVDPTTHVASGGTQNTAAGSRVNFIIKY